MSRKDRLTAFAAQIGFEAEAEADVVRVVRVPCLFAGGVPGTCAIETSYDPATGRPDDRIGGAVHAVKITNDGEYDGRVYHADGTPIGNYVGGDGKTWSNISIKRGATGLVGWGRTRRRAVDHRPGLHHPRQVGGGARPRLRNRTRRPTTCSTATRNRLWVRWRPPVTPSALRWRCLTRSTYPTRSRTGLQSRRFRTASVVIASRLSGLGGTGAHLLDFIAKTPVSEIHLLDPDCVDWHTFMRAPGAPTAEEIEQVRAGPLGLHCQNARVGNPSAGS